MNELILSSIFIETPPLCFLRKVYPTVKVCQMYILFMKKDYSEDIKRVEYGARLLQL